MVGALIQGSRWAQIFKSSLKVKYPLSISKALCLLLFVYESESEALEHARSSLNALDRHVRQFRESGRGECFVGYVFDIFFPLYANMSVQNSL